MPPALSSLRIAVLLTALLMPVHTAVHAAEQRAQTHVRFMAWENEQTGLHLAVGPQTHVPLSVPAYEFGPPATLPTGFPLRITQLVDGPEGPRHQTVAEASLPPDCRAADAYLVRQADQGPLRSYRLIAIPNDPATFAPGQVRVFNFTPHPAALRIGEESTRLAPLAWRLFPGNPDRKHRVLLLASLQTADGVWTHPVRDMVTLRENYRGTFTLMHTRRSLDPEAPDSLRDTPRMLTRGESEYLHPSPAAPLAGKFR